MIGFFFTFSTCALQECKFLIENNANLVSMDNIMNFECKNITLINITSLPNENSDVLSFCEISKIQSSEHAVLSFINCNFAKSNSLIRQSGGTHNIDVLISNSDIGTGFNGVLAVHQMIITNCIINITTVSNKMNGLACNNIHFYNCTFVGSIVKDFERIFNIRYNENVKVSTFEVEFTDCCFDLDDNWKESTSNNEDDVSKQFITVEMKHEYTPDQISVNLSFIRCFTTTNAKHLRLIKVAGGDNDKQRISVSGENCGVEIQWCWVQSNDKLLTEHGQWEAVVNNTNYYPSSDASTESQSSNMPNDDQIDHSQKEKKWQIIAIVFIALFAVCIIALIVAVVIFFVAKKKKFDKSENEN